jgi:orotidine-5'-phosphate decarboxylase
MTERSEVHVTVEPHPARDHLVLALDVDSLDDALALVRRLRPWFGVAKVGREKIVLNKIVDGIYFDLRNALA